MAAPQRISFTRGVPPPEALAQVARPLEECFRSILFSDATRTLQYGHQPGYPPLRELIANQYYAKVENVMVGNGSLQLHDLLAGHLLANGGTVFVEQPTYDRALATFGRHQANVVGIPILADGLDISALTDALSRVQPKFMYLVPDFQNPTGITLSLEKRRAVIELAEKHNFYIIEDIPYRLLRYRGSDVPMLRELNSARMIAVSSYSKLISPGLRVGYAVGPADIIASIIKLGEQTYLSPVLVTQAAVAEFIDSGQLSGHIDWLKRLYEPRLDAMIKAIADHLPDASLTSPEGGFFVSIELPRNADITNLVERASEIYLDLTAGSTFFAPGRGETAGNYFLRLPFCAVTPEEIAIGVERLAKLTQRKS